MSCVYLCSCRYYDDDDDDRDYRAERRNYDKMMEKSYGYGYTGLNHDERWIRRWYEKALGYN